ncbi:MAG: cupin domain-containing protein [Myxococcaceae bacterium]|uniref:Cupin domain-containing protein n=1 Tax=Corallococcus terminator TaxID=2316733 RepID=A0A3A8J9C8_9BACT|nr:cupin domain-containing protein [Corallococcus terminator]RYZ37907.1 MAG: cupin domain-containing protein [Myxococcaceae bacterium]
MTTTKRVEKPWGHELIWAHTERYVGKLLHVKAGHKLSLQFHERKDETIHVQSGKLLFVVDEGQGLIEKEMNPGESYHITPFTKHRMVAITDCDILEVSTPELDDVVRLEDSYGRAGTSKA